MITENLSTLKIHKISQAQYEREYEAGRLDPTALYLTPDENVLYVTQISDEEGNISASHSATEIIDFIQGGGQAWFDLGGEDRFPVVTYTDNPPDSKAVIFWHYYADTPNNIESYTIYNDKTIEYGDNHYALYHDLDDVRDYVIFYNCTVPNDVTESAEYCVPVYFNWDEITNAIAHNRRIICKIKHDAYSPHMFYEYILTKYHSEESEITFNNGELSMYSDGSLYFAPSTLIVTVDETNKASHSSTQIFDYVNKGGLVLFCPHGSDTYYNLMSIDADVALFSAQPYDTPEYTCYEIYVDKNVMRYEHYMLRWNDYIQTPEVTVINTESEEENRVSTYLTPDGLSINRDGEGFYIMAESNDFNEDEDTDCAVAEFWGSAADETVVLRRVASPLQQYDAANKRYVDAQVESLQNQIGDISTALDSILEIQNSLMGGGQA